MSKTASLKAVPASDDVTDFAQSLISAESVSAQDPDFEKTAMELNRAEALLQIKTLQKLAAFRTKALKDGHSEEQVNEAIEKISAKKTRDNLVTLLATETLADPGKDKNSLVKKKIPAHEIGQSPATLDTTKSLGNGT